MTQSSQLKRVLVTGPCSASSWRAVELDSVRLNGGERVLYSFINWCSPSPLLCSPAPLCGSPAQIVVSTKLASWNDSASCNFKLRNLRRWRLPKISPSSFLYARCLTDPCDPLMLSTIFLPFAAQLVIAAQLVSPNWRKPNITASPADRISIVGAALEQATNHISLEGQFNGEPYDVAGILYSQLAKFDLATGQRKYEDTLLKYFPLAEGTRTNFSDDLSYGRAAARAYSVYHTQAFLDYAIQSWSFGRRNTLSQENISAGKTDMKQFPLAKVCHGLTMAGGTFYVGTEFLLSLLFWPRQHPTRCTLNAARELADFIHAHLYNIGNVIQDSISAGDCSTTPNVIMPYNSGLTIEGLSILASITKNASTLGLLTDIITTAATQNSAWQQNDGILLNAGGKPKLQMFLNLVLIQFPADLVKDLGVAYARNVTDPELRDYIKAYIAVQFNAIVDLSTTSGTNVYAVSWTGPPSSQFNGGAQTAALRVLLSAIPLQNDSLPTLSGSDVLPSPSNSFLPLPPSGKSSKTGLIVASVLGGLTLVASVILSLWMFRRRRLRQASPVTSAQELISPFTEMSTFPRDSKSGTTRVEQEYTQDASPDTQSVDPMARLIALLHELQPRQWSDGQAPPNYTRNLADPQLPEEGERHALLRDMP
ncbi:hypothetical protein C8J57DRAFT_1465868 [Mycena rebaudengoi]|nr:hypothetical protein C8J57DRAFT_1465868 [Mycena rebaudengoi]